MAVLVGENRVGGLGLASDEEDPAVGLPGLQGIGGERVEREHAVGVLGFRAGDLQRARGDLLGDAHGGVVEVGPGETGELAVAHAAGEGQQVANAALFRGFLGLQESLGFGD
ncbi:MAG: hypothetical protein HS104_24260 [Polyangiaceae bacterium]|nr:hypothetical protein [Polyangiaceae bacterium]